MSPRRWLTRTVLALSLLPARAEAEPSRSYGLFRIGVDGNQARIGAGSLNDRTVNLQPALGLSVYGGDWFLKLDLGGLLASGLDAAGAPIARPIGGGVDDPSSGRELVAHVFPGAFGALEVGTHWPTGPGALAVGLVVDGVRVGLNDRDRDGPWLAGGAGLDGGVSVHYAFPIMPGLRLDPSAAVGGSLLFDQPRASGVWVRAELVAFLQIADYLSLYLGGSVDGRQYATENEDLTFSGRVIGFQGGIALHGLLGLGEKNH